MADNALIQIEKTAEEYSLVELDKLPNFQRAIKLAQGMQKLRSLIKGDILKTISSLQDTQLGFKTDRAGKDRGYSQEVVRDCAIEAMLRGATITGNEFNIIASRTYLTKEFYERMCRNLVNELRVVEGVPVSQGGGALVPMKASWKYEGRADSLECVQNGADDTRIPVRVNSGMGVDAVLGKAYRKLYARIYRRVTGSTWIEEGLDETTEDPDVIEGEVVQEMPPEKIEQEPVATSENDWSTAVSSLNGIREIDEFEANARDACKTDEQVRALEIACDIRKEEIRETRGPRSNGGNKPHQQPELL